MKSIKFYIIACLLPLLFITCSKSEDGNEPNPQQQEEPAPSNGENAGDDGNNGNSGNNGENNENDNPGGNDTQGIEDVHDGYSDQPAYVKQMK